MFYNANFLYTVLCMQAERVSVWYSNPVKASSPREVMHYPTPTQVVHSQGVLRANQLTDLCTIALHSMVLLKEVHVSNSWYREFSPYANFITANFITAVFQNYS